jgi:hypothetical protein
MLRPVYANETIVEINLIDFLPDRISQYYIDAACLFRLACSRQVSRCNLLQVYCSEPAIVENGLAT